MKNQVRGRSLFCMFGECENLALFGDYCKDHQLQRAEAAEASAATAERQNEIYAAELDALAQRELRIRNERDEARRQLEHGARSIV